MSVTPTTAQGKPHAPDGGRFDLKEHMGQCPAKEYGDPDKMNTLDQAREEIRRLNNVISYDKLVGEVVLGIVCLLERNVAEQIKVLKREIKWAFPEVEHEAWSDVPPGDPQGALAHLEALCLRAKAKTPNPDLMANQPNASEKEQ